MTKTTHIRISTARLKQIKKAKRKDQSVESAIFSRRPMITDLLSKETLRKLRKESFVTRNHVIQEALNDLARRRKK